MKVDILLKKKQIIIDALQRWYGRSYSAKLDVIFKFSILARRFFFYGWIWFYGISTIVGYLLPIHFYASILNVGFQNTFSR